MQPTDRMKVKLLASYENSKPADSALTNPALGKFVRNSDRPDLFQGKLTNYNVTINYEFDFAELISSTTLSDYDASFYVDLAGTFAQTFPFALDAYGYRSEEHTSELQSLMRITYAVLCLKKKNKT